MTKGILGKKLGMSQWFESDGRVVPVTVIEAGPCVVLQKKDIDNDGYESIQIGIGDKSERRTNRPDMGHVKKANTSGKRLIREIRNVDLASYEVGQEIKADLFSEGDVIDVTGTSKGKGFQGSIKRHNQSTGPMSHGSRYHRRPGSMGPVAPNRVMKGKKLPGRMGRDTVTIQNLVVMKVDAERNVLLVKGAVPGPRNSYLTIRSAAKSSNA